MRKVIVIGGSSGGINSLCKILEGVPAQFPAPVNERHRIQEGIARQSSSAVKKRHQENADAAKHDMRLLHGILARL